MKKTTIYFRLWTFALLATGLILGAFAARAQAPSSVGWTASVPGPTGTLSCNQWSATWCSGSGTYSEVGLQKGINYTIENIGSSNCGAPLASAWMQLWKPGGTIACNYDPVTLPLENLLTFNAPESATFRLGVSSNNAAAAANTCGGAKGHDFTGQSAVLRYRQNTSITNTTSTLAICNGGTKALTSVLGGAHDNPDVVWSVVSGGGTIAGTTYTAATPGTVTVRATVGACFSDVSFNVQEAATAPTTITGTDYICYGTNTTLTASGGTHPPGTQYEWGTGSVVGQNVIAGATTDVLTTGNLLTTTTFWVRRKNIGGNCGGSYTDGIQKVVNVSVGEVTETISICESELPYTWNGIVVNSGGTAVASYQTMSSINCDSVTLLDLVVAPAPSVQLGNDTAICDGETLTLNAGSGSGLSYNWNTGATTQQITVSQSGTYIVSVTNSIGCEAVDSIQVNVGGSMPSIGGIQVTNMGAQTYKFSVLNPSNVVAYEWDFDDGTPVSTQPEPTHTYAALGNYMVKVKISSSCGFIFDFNYVNVVSIGQVADAQSEILVYPNPSTGVVTIASSGTAALKWVSVVNLLGQEVGRFQATDPGKVTLSLAHLPKGVYQLILDTGGGRLVHRLTLK